MYIVDVSLTGQLCMYVICFLYREINLKPEICAASEFGDLRVPYMTSSIRQWI